MIRDTGQHPGISRVCDGIDAATAALVRNIEERHCIIKAPLAHESRLMFAVAFSAGAAVLVTLSVVFAWRFA